MNKIFLTVSVFAMLASWTPATASRISATPSNISASEPLSEEAADLALSPVSAFWQRLQSSMADELRELGVPVEAEFRAAMEPTGEAEPDWKTKGVDVVRHIKSLPGGVDGNGLLTIGDVPALQFFGAIPANILADWEFVQAGPKAIAPTDGSGGMFVAISPVHIAFVADEDMQVGNARCMQTAVDRAADHVTVYRYARAPFEPDEDASIQAEAEAVVMHYLLGSIASPVFCTIFQQDEDGIFTSHSYSPDGRPLAMLDDAGDRVLIVSSFDLYRQLTADFISAFADDESLYPAEEARDPS